jgi:tetratricopeptide (TPR) repeat protein
MAALLVIGCSPLLLASTAEATLAQGRVDEAIAQIGTPKDADAHNLLCRAYYSEEHADEALRECEAASAAEPGNAKYELWVGRVLGLKADKSGPMSAMGWAKKTRAAIEKAVQLDPKYAEALSDLGEFYTGAPGIVGGGADKAVPLAQRLLAIDAARGHRLLAEIAEKQGNNAQAEKEFQAAATGAHTAAGFVDLAAYYKHHGSKAQVLAAVKKAVAADTARDYSVSDAAGVLLESKQQASVAQQLYRSYLDGPSRSEDAPACRVYTQLGRSLVVTGDIAGAQKAFAAALSLAKGYTPAQKEAASSKTSTFGRR